MIDPTQITYRPWRHGGWYTSNRLPNGASGCVSRNYDDRRWRIVEDPRGFSLTRFHYATRLEAALAELALIQAGFYAPAEVSAEVAHA